MTFWIRLGWVCLFILGECLVWWLAQPSETRAPIAGELMFDESIINGDLHYSNDDGFSCVRFKIRLPWYRSLTAKFRNSLLVMPDFLI
jgi:hypothetical protein